MTFLLAIACGAVIGLVLGALGGGGSILAVPALVYVLGQSAQDAVTASLVVVGISAAVSVIGYHHDRSVRWKTGAVFVLVGVGAAFGGSALNREVSQSVLLSSFAAVMALSAVGMLLKAMRDRPTQDVPCSPHAPGTLAEDASKSVLLAPMPTMTEHKRPKWLTATLVVLAALLVGFLTGFLGVGGGFIVVPALVMILGFSMPVATGTSLLIIALNSATTLAIHAAGQVHFDWAVIAPFTIATIVTAQIGRLVAGRLSSRTLTIAFAAVLLLVGTGMGLEVALPHLSAK